ncbi:LCP family protein [Amnibacterium sp. CER49]|uniref:LCP family protein n=1 Tax=Amnibacterium sp. CER49 TaxID=3039161 RepID=UPI00244C68EC|nr:LCP family protein [Amnibacterium sp. CER49]MDH2442914.1 LCP family protein [Amnibacterium sp. CER49]
MAERPVTVRHGRARRRARPWTHVLRLVAIGVAVAVVSTGSLAAVAAWRLTSELQSRAVDIGSGKTETTPEVSAFSGSFDVLLVGEDNSRGQSGYGAAREATLNDVNILVHVAADHRSATVVSLPRDLVIDQPRCTDAATKQVSTAVTAEPLNTAIGRGGLGCVVATVEQVTGLRIPYAALFSFAGTVAMADAVGGVQVCTTKAIDDPAAGLVLPAGVSTVTGRTALAYLRSRHGVGDGSDLGRIASQQAYMSSLLRKMTSSSTLMSPTALFALGSAAAQNVTLSTSLADVRTMVTMALALKQVPLSKIAFVQYPTTEDPADPNKVVPDAALATTLLSLVDRDEAISLNGSNLRSSSAVAETGTSSATASVPPPSSPSASPSSSTGSTSSSTSSATSGLTGQTANERVCSVAAGG